MTVVARRGQQYVVRYGETVQGFLFAGNLHSFVDDSNVRVDDASIFVDEYAKRMEERMSAGEQSQDPAVDALIPDYLAADIFGACRVGVIIANVGRRCNVERWQGCRGACSARLRRRSAGQASPSIVKWTCGIKPN